MTTKFSTILIAFFIISLTTIAQQEKPAQKNRVVLLVRNGQMTRSEVAIIHEEHKEVKAKVKQARAEGNVTKTEVKQIEAERVEANQAIIRAKHNNKVRR